MFVLSKQNCFPYSFWKSEYTETESFELQGWLPGLKGEGDSEQLPTIAIVANYDTFGAAPVCLSKKCSHNVLLDVSDNTDFLRHFLWEATAMEVELWLF